MTNQISFDDFSAAARKARDLRASARESLKLLVEFGSGQDELSIALASLCAARALRCLEDARKVEESSQ